MGFKEITLKLPTDYSEEMLRHETGRNLGINKFTYQVSAKSLDARNKRNIHWLLRIGVSSEQLRGNPPEQAKSLEIPYHKRNERAIVVGSGPAGFFAALVLQKAGYYTTIVERGTDVSKRAVQINRFEKTGQFYPRSNYPFGEGGAGTFSDGKLTSRSKHISIERDFVLKSYIRAGAPAEIAYLAHPHLGTDKLRIIVKNLRREFQELGGEILFETTVEDLVVKRNKVVAAVTDHGLLEGDIFIIAPGHSSYDTYRMLMKHGVMFRTKNFAIGTRVEHPQQVINLAQWGRESLSGVKAAEYRLTSRAGGKGQVYTFCMCPGGTVVPAMATDNTFVVNGMSYFSRGGDFANAACVVATNAEKLAGRSLSPLQVLDYMEDLEHRFFNFSGDYRAPFCSISDFLKQKEPVQIPDSSYPLGLKPAMLWQMLPEAIVLPLREGLREFNNKLKNYKTGNMIGLESKTSSPVQVIRHANGLCEGFRNLFVAGEGSGYAGGIISSASDGIRVAMGIAEK